MFRTLSRTVVLALGVACVAWSAPTLIAGGQALGSADAKTWIGEWALTIQGIGAAEGGHDQRRHRQGSATLVASEVLPSRRRFERERLVLKFKQQGRGGEVDVVMTLAMQADGTLKVSQELGGNTQSGTGKKK